MRRRLVLFFLLLCVVGAGFWSVMTLHRVAKADTISTLLSGSAYGLAINTGNLTSGPFGEVSTICTPYPTNQEQTLMGVDLFHGLLTSSKMQDRLTFSRSDENSSVEASSNIANISIGQPLLAPLVEVDGLHAVARSNAKIGLATSDTSSSFFGTVKIAGLNLPLHIAPNTRIILPALGTIVLNEQITRNTGPVNSYAEVNMVDITLGLHNILGQPVGTRILIGHSVSTDTIVSVLAAMQAHAYGLYTELGIGQTAIAQLGPTPNTKIGCVGGVNQASAADLRVGGLVDAGIANISTVGVLNPAQNTVSVTSSEKIAHLSILGGLIRADSLKENAYATYNSAGTSGSGNFETTKLSIGEIHVLRIHAPNKRIDLPGLGYVVVDEVVPSEASTGYALNALDITVTTNNRWNLAVGLHIIVGHVDAGIAIFH